MKVSPHICPRYQLAVELIGKRWTGLVLQLLLTGPKRFSELASTLEVVSERVLSERLKELEAEGVVLREVKPGPPVSVAYRLTAKGEALGKVVDAIAHWAENWTEAPPAPKKPAPAKRRP